MNFRSIFAAYMLQGPKRFIYQTAVNFWNHIVLLGVYPTMPFIEARRTMLLNLLSLPCIPFMISYCIINAFQGRYLLSALNAVTTSTAVAVLLLHKYRMYLSARIVLIFFSVVLYTFTGLYFHNGAEYFLLNILVVSVMIYDNKWVIGCLSILILSAFLLIIFMPQSWYLAPPVPQQREWTNVAVSLVSMIIALLFFKYIQSDYQEEIEKQRQALLAMNKDKEKLFSIVAHDIRSPLSTLESLLDMFQKGQYPRNDMEEAAATLHQKVSQLGGTLDNVLRWSTRSMKGIQTRPRHFLLAPVMSEILLFFELVIQQKNMQVDVQVPVSTALFADRDQVSVILRNLFSNALKFSYAGGKISVTAWQTEEQVFIRIVDDGVGMDMQQLKTLFTSQQQPAYGTTGERGAGIGLLLCHEFTELNNGTITVESAPENGTTFIIQLRRGDIPANEPAAANEPTAAN
ncbi:MAG: HAMP domain-containing histidine kinase [Chitinophaga sp.]|uniref:sensor histidine kinase n=1 Tax=Chitinophaga sp. TaxID=1869181 RepID=UPI001B03D364|nr:HAMP domain-containing sensor histidine kinase [Chitinophaga sp.]MBO9731554.1 HAMP domain-containing histidine kinase [Chitinophaga sp.]